ncbi:unnamed protein product (macronuclear) [Paramecium tetraurelia]|uniref:G domain-containing protein n=1 Tax=Paramecium tetraurelia TaxID=5888 RepID=A0C0T1_PARTE|nr:uncharacterized protein GSPATT00033874001 [Paramecium tetraurelia]CAK64398.1 unnamed protein product [Paramecium tetraurelia]|eukprot:XP_001431796.1 hypothetical protein (macronuclear) [Paramecium tetraurelia strain d4-2]
MKAQNLLDVLAIGVSIYALYQIYQEKVKKLNNNQSFQTLKYILVGPPGVGKTKLFKKIVNTLKNSNQLEQGIQECLIRKDIDLVYTPALDFENIEQREINITIFQQYMQKNHIAHFFFLVNFERTDLMRKKLLELYKYFKKFKEKITIVITDFQLSDNEEQDKQNLKQAFSIYLNSNKSIMFVKNDFDVEEFRNQLLAEAQAFSLRDTIFEPINEDEQKQLLIQFQNKFIEGQKMIQDSHFIHMDDSLNIVENQP